MGNPFASFGDAVRLFILAGGTFGALVFIWWMFGIKSRMEEIEDELMPKRGGPGKRGGISVGDYVKVKAIAFISAIGTWPLAVLGTCILIWALRYMVGLKYVLLKFISDPAIVQNLEAFFIK